MHLFIITVHDPNEYDIIHDAIEKTVWCDISVYQQKCQNSINTLNVNKIFYLNDVTTSLLHPSNVTFIVPTSALSRGLYMKNIRYFSYYILLYYIYIYIVYIRNVYIKHANFISPLLQHNLIRFNKIKDGLTCTDSVYLYGTIFNRIVSIA